MSLIPFNHVPWVSVWVMIDDMSDLTGGLNIIPFGEVDASTPARFEEEIRPMSDVRPCYKHKEDSGNMVGYIFYI